MNGDGREPRPDLADTSDDAFLGGALIIRQPVVGYRAGLDAVLLAAAAPVDQFDARRETFTSGQRVLDAGAGVGVVGLAIARRVASAEVMLLEVDDGLVHLARDNAARNNLADRVVALQADIERGGALCHDSGRPEGLNAGSFDHVVANPPYYTRGEGTAPQGARRARAHQMPGGGLDRWVALAATALRHGGTLTMIHRADAMAEILAALDGRFGGVRVLPVQPKAGSPANRVLVSAAKGSKAPLVLLAGLVLHDETGRSTAEMEAVMRDGASLDHLRQ